ERAPSGDRLCLCRSLRRPAYGRRAGRRNAGAGPRALMRHARLGATFPDRRARRAACALYRIAVRSRRPRAIKKSGPAGPRFTLSPGKLLRLARTGGRVAVLVLVARNLVLGALQVLLRHHREVLGAREL